MSGFIYICLGGISCGDLTYNVPIELKSQPVAAASGRSIIQADPKLYRFETLYYRTHVDVS
jgi:hypothetical protein